MDVGQQLGQRRWHPADPLADGYGLAPPGSFGRMLPAVIATASHVKEFSPSMVSGLGGRRATRLIPCVQTVHAAACPANGPDEAAVSVLPYRLAMPARKRPGPQDAATARRMLLDGMARDTEVFELVGELAPLHPRDNTFPGEVL